LHSSSSKEGAQNRKGTREVIEGWLTGLPADRRAEPNEAALFLGSEASSYVIGAHFMRIIAQTLKIWRPRWVAQLWVATAYLVTARNHAGCLHDYSGSNSHRTPGPHTGHNHQPSGGEEGFRFGLAQAMHAAMDLLDAEDDLFIGVITGAGGNFSAGA